MAAGQAFYNVSDFTLRAQGQQPGPTAARQTSSPTSMASRRTSRRSLTKFKFRNQIQTLVEADVLGHLIENFLDPRSICRH